MDHLAQQINEQLDKDPDGFVEINMMQLLQHWQFNNATDIDITRQLLKFAKVTNLQYITILMPGGPAVVRFWKENTKHLTQGESNE